MADASSHIRKRHVITPTVYQMEAVECGAASLAMILGYYGRIVPLEELRRACGVSRDGSKASNILSAARSYGMEAKGFQRPIDDVYTGDLPVIVFWKFNHFLVVEGVSDKWVWLNDPLGGRTRITHEDFDKGYTGITLTFKPGPDFTKGGSSPSMFSALVRRLHGVRAALAYVLIASLFLILPGLVIPAFSKVFVDEILIRGHGSWMKPLLLGMGITVAVHILLLLLQKATLLRLETKVAVRESSSYMWHVLRLPVDFFQQRFAGDIAQRVQINDNVAHTIGGKLATTVLSLMMIVFYALVMLSYSVPLTLATFAVAMLNIVAVRFVGSHLATVNAKLLQEQGKVMGVSMNGLQIIETLKAGGTESDFFARWAGYQAKALDSQRRVQIVMQVLLVVPPMITTITTAAVLGLGGWYVMDGSISAGTLVAFQALLMSFLAPINDVVNLYGEIQRLRGDMTRLDDVLRYKLDDMTQERSVDADLPAKLEGYVELKGVTFGYSPLAAPLITDFNLKLVPGSRVAIVGKSGSGKSTISRLLMGLYQPWSGEIMFDGRRRDEWPRDILVSSLAFVDQDIFLFDGSVEDNLTMWNSSIPRPRVVNAAKDASIHDVIASRPGGYASHVEETGRNYSGGQAQRLEIARALAGDPRIVVLDEATSALDPLTEQQIDDRLRQRGCTTIIIAHRLSTIRDCDEIIVLENGKVVQRGTHEEMKDVDGPYARLISTE